MSHHIYHTEAFILGSRPHGEANKYVKLFTRDLGLVVASAQGIRHGRSKLRYSTQDYSYGTVALVRGKEVWRMTNALGSCNLRSVFRESPELFQVFVRVFSLLERLLAGEEKHEKLFVLLHDAFVFFGATHLSEVLIRNAEYVLVLRILHELGYVGDIPACRGFLATYDWGEEVLRKVGDVERDMLLAINASIRESQL